MLVTKAILRGKGGYATLPLSFIFSTGAGIGDARHYIEVSVKLGQQVNTNQLVEIMLSGEANNWVKYYDVGCTCRGK